MYAPPEESINNGDNESEDSNIEDEDELTRIISPEGTCRNYELALFVRLTCCFSGGYERLP